MSISRIDQTVVREDGSVIYAFRLNGFLTYLYQPANELQSNLINYGFTGPTMAVFPDRKLTMEEMEKFAEESGLAQLSRKNGTGIVFLNPKGETWAGEEAGAYEALTANLAIAQSNFRDGMAIMKDDAYPDRVAYNVLGSCVRMYVYAFGTGADYVSRNYLRPMAGSAILGDLGRADLTMVCCTLVGGKEMPKPEKNDIHVVSVGHTAQYNAVLEASCGQVVCRDDLDLARDFKEVVGNYRRWRGEIVKAYNYDAENIVDQAASVMLPVSDDNEIFAKRRMFRPVKEHKVGYVVFYDKDLDVKNGKVPLMLVFHGGGDSAYATASLAEWPEIGQAEGFITVAVEMHMMVSAKEVSALIDHLMTQYSIDPGKIYATGFSMGGIKSWDLFEQCPERFAALLPMNAIDYVGNNCFGTKTQDVNRDTLVPLFYIGGVDSFGVELPMHHERAIQRLEYLSQVNRFRKPFHASLEEKDRWEDPLMAVKGDRVELLHDDSFPDSQYFAHYFDSEDGNCYTLLMGVTHHAHEIRPFTNRFAWDFVKRFRRTENGIVIE